MDRVAIFQMLTVLGIGFLSADCCLPPPRNSTKPTFVSSTTLRTTELTKPTRTTIKLPTETTTSITTPSSSLKATEDTNTFPVSTVQTWAASYHPSSEFDKGALIGGVVLSISFILAIYLSYRYWKRRKNKPAYERVEFQNKVNRESLPPGRPCSWEWL